MAGGLVSKPTLMLDVDGVLITGRPSDGAFWATGLDQDLGLNPEDIQAQFFAPYWADVVLGRRDLMDCLHAIWPGLGVDVSAEAFVRYWFAMDARVDQAVMSACADLRGHGHKVFLATNQDHMRAGYILNDLGLKEHVDGIFYSAAMGVKKPDAAFFAKAGAGVTAPFLLDDTAANVDAARQAGWDAEQWQTGMDVRQTLEQAGFDVG